jgi:hypothetical protein
VEHFFYARVMIAAFVSNNSPCTVCGAVPSALMVVAWNPGENGGQVRPLDVCSAFCAGHTADGHRLGEQLRAKPNGQLEIVGPSPPDER